MLQVKLPGHFHPDEDRVFFLLINSWETLLLKWQGKFFNKSKIIQEILESRNEGKAGPAGINFQNFPN